ncbi:DUF488 domain-containing protein [Tatumella citrea]|uniref:MarR family transcriptional regulator n=1 Tax=Tatumella citrea TaxID=53336 RepID=A0A1Y0L8R7_TATCI|nr:DUF488 family protein [Tatumella citrea]ARU94424.1 MarR family transcriptional regulator [Tatumella citrea]ARU98463.1 MarR family transcriptional regulator [Tatumella citrea]
MIRYKRVYDPAEQEDGWRVLADRLWPRGVSKTLLRSDEWCKTLAPSTQLRQHFHQQTISYSRFATLYRAELAAPELQAELQQLAARASVGTVTLLSAVKDLQNSHLTVLAEALQHQLKL